MITPQHMLSALLRLSLTNNYTERNVPLKEAASAWAEVVSDEVPGVELPDLVEGVKAYAAVGDSAWPRPADLIPHIRRAHYLRTLPPKCGRCDHHRQVERTEERRGLSVTVIARCPTCHPATKQITAR